MNVLFSIKFSLIVKFITILVPGTNLPLRLLLASLPSTPLLRVVLTSLPSTPLIVYGYWVSISERVFVLILDMINSIAKLPLTSTEFDELIKLYCNSVTALPTIFLPFKKLTPFDLS